MSGSSSRSPRELLHGFHQAMLALSADDLADLHTEDAVYEFPLLSPGRPSRYAGREEIREGFRSTWAAAAIRIEAIRAIEIYDTTDRDLIVAEQRAAAVSADGRRFELPFLLLLRARDGYIVAVRDYADALRAAVELGRLPALTKRLAAS